MNQLLPIFRTFTLLALLGTGVSAQVTGSPGHLDVYEGTLVSGGEPERVVLSPEGIIAVYDRRDGVSFFSPELAPIGPLRTHRLTFPGSPVDLPDRREIGARDRVVTKLGVTVTAHPDLHCVEVSSGNAFSRIGAFGARNGLFSRPQGVAVHDEKIFVADTANHRIQVFTLDGVPLYRFGIHQLEPRQGEGRLHYPTSITIAPDGERAFVVEPLEGRVQVFRARTSEDPPLTPAATWERADLPAHFGEHWAVNGEWLLIAEPDAERVSLYQIRVGAEPVRVSELGGIPGGRLGQWRNPGSIAVLPARENRPRFVVHDRGNHRLQVIEVEPPNGPPKFDRRLLRVVSTVSLPPWLPVGEPSDVVPFIDFPTLAARDGFLYVAASNRAWDCVVKRESSGRKIESWKLSGPATHVVAEEGVIAALLPGSDRSDARIEILELQPSTEPRRTFEALPSIEPAGLARFGEGWLISCRRSHRLVVLDSRGRVTRFIGAPGTGPVEFHHPRAVVVDAEQRIWVLDHGNHRGQVLDSSGAFLWAFGSKAYVKPILDALRSTPPRED